MTSSEAGGGGSPASVSGKWSFLLTSNNGSSNNVDLEANFSQSTGAISAAQSVILSSSPCDFGTDFIQGTVKRKQHQFHAGVRQRTSDDVVLGLGEQQRAQHGR